ncbi:TPA: hypothetical protein ACUMFU_001742, partial [Haemophilus influenzae]
KYDVVTMKLTNFKLVLDMPLFSSLDLDENLDYRVNMKEFIPIFSLSPITICISVTQSPI